MTLTPAKRDRIEGAFIRGYSLDLISEWGVHEGWTRDEARQVVADREWSLDWSGRLLDRYRPQAQIDRMAPAGPQGDLEALLSVGLDHEQVAIRRAAVKAKVALDHLRNALVRQDERDAEEVVRLRREKRLR